MPRGRIGQTPKWAKEESETRILNSLTGRTQKTFKQILHETELSEPTIAKRLKELLEKGEITCEINSQDRRSKNYTLTSDGIESLQKKLIIHDLGLTSLFFNSKTMLFDINDRKRVTPSHISPVFALEKRGSKVLQQIRNDFNVELFRILKTKYPTKSKKQIEKNCSIFVALLLKRMSTVFSLNFFSPIKARKPKKSKWRSLNYLLGFSDPIKYDYYANIYINFFEYFLIIIYDIFKTEYSGNFKEFVSALNQDDLSANKMMVVMSFELGIIPVILNQLEIDIY